MENDLGIFPLEHVELKLARGPGQVNDRIDAFLANGQSQPFIGLQGMERAQNDPIGIPLFLEHIDGGQLRLKTDHINRLREVVIDLKTGTVDKNVQLEGSHGSF
jgi:hypothetical protein